MDYGITLVFSLQPTKHLTAGCVRAWSSRVMTASRIVVMTAQMHYLSLGYIAASAVMRGAASVAAKRG